MSAPLKQTPVQRATEAWGETMPEWVRAVAEACEKETQAAVGKRFGYSGSTVNQLLSNTYRGDIGRVEASVRGGLMSETVLCPILQDIPRNVCLTWQKRPFSTASANAVRMHRACRSGCKHSRLNGNRDGGDDAL